MQGLAIGALRESYRQAREEIRTQFLEDGDPDRTLKLLTENLDELVSQVAGRYLGEDAFCILAIGGFGRRELYPYSDVDLLFLFRPERRAEAEPAISATLHDLWDLRLHLGQQVWSLDDLKTLSLDDLEFLLALLDARFLSGDTDLARTLQQEIFPEFLREHDRDLVQRIIALTEERHRAHRNTIYQLEPDLKQCPGGLRDYLVGQWLPRLASAGHFLPYTEAQVEAARGFMRKLRIFLHFFTGRNQNQLTHRLQEEVSRWVGYRGTSARSGVESLMKEYFLNARILYGFCRRSLASRKDGPPAPSISLDGRRKLGSMEEVLELFRRSVLEGKPLDDECRRAVVRALPALSRKVVFPELRDRIRDLLKPRPGLYRVLGEMYELGVLELFFPEFGSIKARVIRDFYHKYTVDEHSLLAIRSIEDLLATQERSDQRFRALLQETSDPDLLVLALLLHDVGKSRAGKHTTASARMAARALKRFRFGRQHVDLVVSLIRGHLDMASVILRRDIEDEEVIRRFADAVNDVPRLRLLCLLTYADIKAVGPGTLTDWKKDLLWQLYVATYRKLTLDFGEERIAEPEIEARLLENLPPDVDRREFERFLEGFPRRYLSTTSAREVYEHSRLASRLTPERPLQLRLLDQGSHYDLWVVTPDRYFLFARIVGLLSYFDMNILRGYGFANRQNTVLDFFQFVDTRDVFRLNPGERNRCEELLRAAVSDELSVEKLLEGKEKSVLFQPRVPAFAPTIYFEDEHSERYTIMEIVAPDSVGLLYRIGREISAQRCNIELVLISTEGDKAVDVFYLTHEGSKLSPELRERLSENIIRSIG